MSGRLRCSRCQGEFDAPDDPAQQPPLCPICKSEAGGTNAMLSEGATAEMPSSPPKALANATATRAGAIPAPNATTKEAGSVPTVVKAGAAILLFIAIFIWLFGWLVFVKTALYIVVASACLCAALMGIGLFSVKDLAERTTAFACISVCFAVCLLSWLALGALPSGTLASKGLKTSEIPLASAVLQGEINGIGWLGTAFVYAREGEVLRLYTNAHCLGLTHYTADVAHERGVQPPFVIGSYALNITFPSEKVRPVIRFAEEANARRDVAIIEVSAKGLKEGEDYVIVPCISDCLETLSVEPGDEVIALGTPAEPRLGGTETFGKVSAIRTWNDNDGHGGVWIQHDAQIFGGNSGGPLFVKKGQRAFLIGINTFTVRTSSISFAVCADEAMQAKYEWANANPQGAVTNLKRVHRIAATSNTGTGWLGLAGVDSQRLGHVGGLTPPGDITNMLMKDLNKSTIWRNPERYYPLCKLGILLILGAGAALRKALNGTTAKKS